MKKIALITADNGNGGAARATRRIAKGLTKLSQDSIIIDLICNGNLDSGYKQKLPTYKWYSKLIYKNEIIRKLIKGIINRLWKKFNVIKKKDEILFFRVGNSINNIKTFSEYDILHIFWGQTFINPGSIADLNKNVIITLHDMWFLTGGIAFSEDDIKEQKKYLNFLGKNNFNNQYSLKKKLINSKKTNLIVTSDWMKKKCINFGIEKKRIHKILNYIPPYYKYLDRKNECMNLLDWDKNASSKIIIYFVGSLTDPRKGFDFLLSSLELLSEDIKSRIAIQILGSKSSNIKALDNLNINYLSLGIYSDEISQIIAYNAADIFICPSILDNTPNVIAEAQMCGLPVFVRDGTGGSEMIKDEESGKIFSRNNSIDLKQKITNYVLKKYNFDSLKISKNASLNFSLENTCQKYIDLYNKIK